MNQPLRKYQAFYSNLERTSKTYVVYFAGRSENFKSYFDITTTIATYIQAWLVPCYTFFADRQQQNCSLGSFKN